MASLAVVVSLVILIQQNRQANQLARDAAMRIHLEGLQEISRALYETEGLADIWHRGNADPSTLNDADRVRYVTFLTYTLRIWEGLHAQQLRGKIDAGLWRSHTQLLRSVQALPGARVVWDLRRHYFSKPFQDFYDGNARSDDARELYLPQQSGDSALNPAPK